MNLAELIIVIPILLFSLSVHEFCHGWVALKLGDPTAKLRGRLTLNPLAHIDIFGLLFAVIFHFGWAKPVPVNPYNFPYSKRLKYMALVGVAGPLSNITLAVAFALLWHAIALTPFSAPEIARFFWIASFINCALFFFNLIPIPPLDGSRLLFALLPRRSVEDMARAELYGIFGIFALVAISFVIPIFDWIVVRPTLQVLKLLY